MAFINMLIVVLAVVCCVMATGSSKYDDLETAATGYGHGGGHGGGYGGGHGGYGYGGPIRYGYYGPYGNSYVKVAIDGWKEHSNYGFKAGGYH